MQQDRIESDVNMSLVQMISTHNIEEQCARITKWLRKYYPLNGIGFFVKEPESTHAHFFTETIPVHIVHDLEEMLVNIYQSEAGEKDTLFFAQKEDRCVALSRQEAPDTLEPTGLVFPLDNLNNFTGALVLVSDSRTIKDLRTKTPLECSVVPLISSLLHNALSHEKKDTKIRLLNLYQTVSSSLAYIGNLQELLTTITGIVTSELFCEESSVLFYEEDTNEFEFFTAFGETGMELVSTRFPADRGIAGRALREGKTQVVNDCKSDPDFYCAIDEEHSFQTKRIISAPLISGDEKVGVINAVNKLEGSFFDKEDDQVLSAIADEVAMAIKNARLFEFVVDNYCKIRQGLNSCKGCKRPLKSWTPCVRQMEMSGL